MGKKFKLDFFPWIWIRIWIRMENFCIGIHNNSYGSASLKKFPILKNTTGYCPSRSYFVLCSALTNIPFCLHKVCRSLLARKCIKKGFIGELHNPRPNNFLHFRLAHPTVCSRNGKFVLKTQIQSCFRLSFRVRFMENAIVSHVE